MWGAAGSGAEMCCCGGGIPGNPGGYARKNNYYGIKDVSFVE
jgi:hypothetical protein